MATKRGQKRRGKHDLQQCRESNSLNALRVLRHAQHYRPLYVNFSVLELILKVTKGKIVVNDDTYKLVYHEVFKEYKLPHKCFLVGRVWEEPPDATKDGNELLRPSDNQEHLCPDRVRQEGGHDYCGCA